MNVRTIVIMVIIILLVALVARRFIQPPRTERTAQEKMSVVVASRDIPPYTVLDEDDLRMKTLPADEIQDTYDYEEGAMGKMTTVEIRQGQPVRRAVVLETDDRWHRGDMLIFSFYVPTEYIVGGRLRPGHHIDLLATRREGRSDFAESLWLARNLWVVGVYQASGEDVPRPTRIVATPTGEGTDGGGGAFGLGGDSGGESAFGMREGPANLVVLAAQREIGRMIGDYFAARQYEPWIYVRPEDMGGDEARIDGLVFEDQNADRMRQREEQGIDGSQITLYDEDGQRLNAVETVSGGRFYFDDLESGTYYVEQEDLPGYTSVSPSRLRVELADGQNEHITFSDRRKQETPTPPPTATPPATPVPTSTPPATSAPTPTPMPTPKEGCPCSLRVSGQEGGSERATFVKDDEIWAVVQFENCPEISYELRASMEEAGGGAYPIQSGEWDGGTGLESIQVKPSMFGQSADAGFALDTYTTEVRIGPDMEVCARTTWKVVESADLPVTGKEADAYSPNGVEFHWGR
jgi:hypothetical protein